MSTNHYQDRVSRVLDYITDHLDEDLSLDRLARIGTFSPFHFHRIFHGQTGETLSSYVRRSRLERAAQLIKHRRVDESPIRALCRLQWVCGIFPRIQRAFRPQRKLVGPAIAARKKQDLQSA